MIAKKKRVRRDSFARIVNIMCTVRCLNGDGAFATIAAKVGCSESTLRRWVREAGFRKVRGKWVGP